MCQIKTWTRIIAKNSSGSNVIIMGTRSDGEIFSRPLIITRRETIFDTAEKVITAINSLETYRNCDCTSSKTCNKHLEF